MSAFRRVKKGSSSLRMLQHLNLFTELLVFLLFHQAKGTLQGEISYQDLTSKLALLTLHFPKVSHLVALKDFHNLLY